MPVVGPCNARGGGQLQGAAANYPELLLIAGKTKKFAVNVLTGDRGEREHCEDCTCRAPAPWRFRAQFRSSQGHAFLYPLPAVDRFGGPLPLSKCFLAFVCLHLAL